MRDEPGKVSLLWFNAGLQRSNAKTLTSKPQHGQAEDHQRRVEVLLRHGRGPKLHVLGDEPRDGQETTGEEANGDEQQGVGEE